MKRASVSERLEAMSMPEPNSGCVLWFGPRTRAGYGQMVMDTRKVYVHRLAYEAAYGPIPSGLLVRHHCDNPPCINPVHLEAGTHANNMQDMYRRGRHGAQPKTDSGGRMKRSTYYDCDVLDWLKERGERLDRSVDYQVREILREAKDVEQRQDEVS